jgi:hypothetical protein
MTQSPDVIMYKDQCDKIKTFKIVAETFDSEFGFETF